MISLHNHRIEVDSLLPPIHEIQLFIFSTSNVAKKDANAETIEVVPISGHNFVHGSEKQFLKSQVYCLAVRLILQILARNKKIFDNASAGRHRFDIERYRSLG